MHEIRTFDMYIHPILQIIFVKHKISEDVFLVPTRPLSPDIWWHMGKDTESANHLDWVRDDSDRRSNVWRLHVQRTHCRHHDAQLLCD